MSLSEILACNNYILHYKGLMACSGGSPVTPGPGGQLIPLNNSNNVVLPFTLTYSSPQNLGTYVSTPMMNWAVFSSFYNNELIYTVSGTVDVNLPTYVLDSPDVSSTLTISVPLLPIIISFGVEIGGNFLLYYSNGELGNTVNSIAEGVLQSDDQTVLFTFNQNDNQLQSAEIFPLSIIMVFNNNIDGVFPVKSMVNIVSLNPGITPPYPIQITVAAGSPDFTKVNSVTLDVYPVNNLVVTPTMISFDPPDLPPGSYLSYGIYLEDSFNKYTNRVGEFQYPTA